MNKDKLLAERVMGWIEFGTADGLKYCIVSETTITDTGIFVKDWHPTENVEQALTCADEYLKHKEHYRLEIAVEVDEDDRIANKVDVVDIYKLSVNNYPYVGYGHNSKLSVAITDALIEAIGGIDE